MKKLGVIVKEVTAKRIKESIKESGNFFVIHYSKLSSPDLSNLRQSLRGANAKFFVIKNSVARRALKDTGLEALTAHIDGPCGMVFIKEDPVNVSKVLCNFAKTHEPLKLKGGVVEERILQDKDIEALSRLPSKEVLRAQVVGALKSPISGIVIVLGGTLKKFVCCLEQIKNKKGN